MVTVPTPGWSALERGGIAAASGRRPEQPWNSTTVRDRESGPLCASAGARAIFPKSTKNSTRFSSLWCVNMRNRAKQKDSDRDGYNLASIKSCSAFQEENER